MKLRAIVEHITGFTTHSVGIIKDGVPEATERIGVPSYVQIEEEDDHPGVLLIHYDRFGRSIADTWHASVSDAKRQAQREFNIAGDCWFPLDA